MIEIESRVNEVESQEVVSSQEGDLEEAEPCESQGETELSLNALASVPRSSSMRLMAGLASLRSLCWLDSGSTHNFINSNVVNKVGLK